ncbi:YopJ family acetyltransferase [Erwinia amylovora]|uniref:Type III secretion system effector Eop1 n=1 Tax=Erwinia amylovora TaxID=552 RepID=F8UV27_ERWAM|nr:YopJ family acetyltransferase [Erwinia amylovora]AEH03410.1 type III secretion system effector Eop1 [Erwinia amylovora]AEH03412.1 type III secretion system effector Eop1 [Erwinia amylovora]AEH03418.1 type III secretion system effector Eop1 [Erwinia amylovora]
MNISGLRGGYKSQAQQADNASSSSTQGSPAPTGRRLQRQDALPANYRYHASQMPATPERARVAARYASQASSSAGPSISLSRQSGHRENPSLARFHETMQQSPKMSRGDPLPEKPEIVPKRLQEKIDSVNLPRLNKLDKNLYEYGKMATELAKEGSGSSVALMRMDKKVLPLLADAENARNPGLNLHVYKRGEECYQAIKEQHKIVQQSGQPKTMRALYPPFIGMPDHHIALDIHLRPGHRPSIVGFESALGHMVDHIRQGIAQGLRGAKVHMVGNRIQNSEWDCIMYSLNNALKSFKHHDEYTARLHKGEKIPVPAEFFKHAQSKSMVEGLPHQDAIVTKDKGGLHAETLLHRNLAYRADRFDHACNTSIEGFRMQEIQRAGEFLSAQNRKS